MSGQTALPALPDSVGGFIGIRYSAPWIYALVTPAAEVPDTTSDLVLRTRDDGSAPWSSVVDPATGQRARSTTVPLVRGEDVVITERSADDPYDGGCVQRPLGKEVAPWPCPYLTLLDGAGLLAGIEDYQTRIRDLATGAVIRTIPSTRIAGFSDGTIWTVTPGGCCLQQVDARTGRTTREVLLPAHCDGFGFRAVGNGWAHAAVVAGTAVARCGDNQVAVSLDNRFPPLAMPRQSELFGSSFTVVTDPATGSHTIVDLAAGGRAEPLFGNVVAEESGRDAVVVQSLRQLTVVRVAPLDPASYPDVAPPSVRITGRPAPARTFADMRSDRLFFGWEGVDAGPVTNPWLAYEWTAVPITPRGPRPSVPGTSPLTTTWDSSVQIDDPARPASGEWREAGLCLFVRAVDPAGNRSAWARACTYVAGTPPDVGWESLTVAGKGSLIEGGHRVTWSGLDEDGPVRFLLERREAPALGGFGAVTRWGPTAARMTQRRTAQGVTTCYRLRAIDTYGTVSAPAVTRDTSRLIDNCVTTPIDDRRLAYRGPVRRSAPRSAVLGTLTTLPRGSRAIVRLSGVRALQVRSRFSGLCPRVTVNGRAVRSRCGFWVAENNIMYPQVEFDRPLSGRFELSAPPEDQRVLAIDAVSAVRRP